jgi:hypothetical protein
MIAAYCPQLPCHGLAIVVTKLFLQGGSRLLSKCGRSRLLLTFWPNRLILTSRSLMEAAKTPHVQLARLKHSPPHQVCWQSYEAQQLSILIQRLLPHSNIIMETSLSRTAIKILISMLLGLVTPVNFRSGLIRASCSRCATSWLMRKNHWLVSLIASLRRGG